MAGQKSDSASALLGIDLGAAEVKIALCSNAGELFHYSHAPCRASPVLTLIQAMEGVPSQLMDGEVRVAITGAGQPRLPPASRCLGVNEVVATALAVKRTCRQVGTVIDLGAQHSKWILLSGQGESDVVADFSSNGLCAAGAGSFLEQQACRLGLDVEDLGRMASAARRGAKIAGRCSVFAKSDMIHLQQKGTPPEEIAYGLCQALVRTFLATVVQGRQLQLPVALVGGGAANPGLARAFREELCLTEETLIVPENPRYFGALGAAWMASMADVIRPGRLLGLLRELNVGTLRPRGMRVLPPLRRRTGETQPKLAAEPPLRQGGIEAYLGLDVGSVSTDLALLSPDLQVLYGVYLPTRGRPLDALNEGFHQIRDRFGPRLRVLGAGSTGSGRHLAASVAGADVTRNEITTQLASSLLFCPEVDTIFEIGGQDSKYISLRDGKLADFAMNKICSGGTGSFLEEQAERLGIRIEGEFAIRALRAASPSDLGARCTVFMESELVRARQQGFSLDDLCAGLAYSVARNYLEKVVAGHPVGRQIMFQGGVASNQAVVEAFRQLLGRPVQVHPYNRLSGAIGAALLAARTGVTRSAFRGFDSCSGSELRSFECQRCENRCQVNRVHAQGRVIHFGDICERYSELDRTSAGPPPAFADLFTARNRLLEECASRIRDPDPGAPRIGLLRASLNLEFLPYWCTFLRELGYEPWLSEQSASTGLQGKACSLPGEICLPIKCAAVHARSLLEAGVERVFVPAVLECPSRGEDDPSHTCFYVQQLPDMLRVELKERVVTAQFLLQEGILGLVGPALALADSLDRSLEAVGRALSKARAAQSAFVAARRRLGVEALNGSFDCAVVVLGRPYNTHDPMLNLGLAHQLRRLGLPAIPWDLLPLDQVRLATRWQTVPWHYCREQLRAIEWIRRDRRLFPILISSYGCGTDGFVVKHVEELLSDRPHLLLEFDEHRGEAGLVTRLEAFNDEISEHLRERARTSTSPEFTPGPRTLPAGRRFYIPHFADHARIYAAVLRSAGYAAEVLDAPGEETVRLGERHSSGRECHPYTILAGELVRLIRSGAPSDGDVFLLPNCTAPCLIRQYGDAHRILLERMGPPELEIWEANAEQLGHLTGIAGLLRLYEGLLATDTLFSLAGRLRAYERETGSTERTLTRVLEGLAEAVAQKKALSPVLEEAVNELWAIQRNGEPGQRPVIGVTGDLYTRLNRIGNAGLVERLEQMGCEVWPSPAFAAMIDLSTVLEGRRQIEKGRLTGAAAGELTAALTARARRGLLGHLPGETRRLVAEPPAEELIRLAQPYVGPRTNHLILLCVAKMVDFLRRGAAGVVHASGFNCVVGTAAAAVIPAIRAAHGSAPIVSLIYGGVEGPAHRLRLEMLVHQVRQRRRQLAA